MITINYETERKDRLKITGSGKSSEVESWLNGNSIKYRLIKTRNNYLRAIEFYNDEDVTAYKLRFNNELPRPRYF